MIKNRKFFMCFSINTTHSGRETSNFACDKYLTIFAMEKDTVKNSPKRCSDNLSYLWLSKLRTPSATLYSRERPTVTVITVMAYSRELKPL